MATFSAGNGLTFYQGSPFVNGASANMREVTDYFQLGGGNQRYVEDDNIYEGSGHLQLVTDYYSYRTKIKLTLPSKSTITVNLKFSDTEPLTAFMAGISQTNVDVIGNICQSGGHHFNETYLEPYIIEEINPLGNTSSSTATLAFASEFEAGTYYIYLVPTATSLNYAKGIIAETTVSTGESGENGGSSGGEVVNGELTLSKNNSNFYNVTTSGVSAITGSTYVRYNDTGTGSWVRAEITVPAGKKWTISEIYTSYTGSTTNDAGYGFTKEVRDVYEYANNSNFDYTAERGTYGSSAGNTYTSSNLSIPLTAGTWYLYVYVDTQGAAWQFVTTNNTKIKLTYTEVTDAVIYIDNGTSWDAYEIYIDNGTSWDRYQAYIDNGTSWDAY